MKEQRQVLLQQVDGQRDKEAEEKQQAKLVPRHLLGEAEQPAQQEKAYGSGKQGSGDVDGAPAELGVEQPARGDQCLQ